MSVFIFLKNIKNILIILTLLILLLQGVSIKTPILQQYEILKKEKKSNLPQAETVQRDMQLLYRFFHGKFPDKVHSLVLSVITFTANATNTVESSPFPLYSISWMEVPIEQIHKNHYFLEQSPKRILSQSLQS